jgi:5-methylcytosine-specific restriction endonuclease McrBC regulatory subunit McrC
MLAFQVEMAPLFERFVATWLKEHLPSHLLLGIQWSIPSGSGDPFRADMVIHDVDTRKCLAVLDTKYKDVGTPSPEDVHQARSYAEALGCANAILVYPTMPSNPIDHRLGKIRTQTLAFSLKENLDEGGNDFLAALLPGIIEKPL